MANQLRALEGEERVALLEQLEDLKVSRCVAQYKMATGGAGPSDPGVGFVFNIQRRMSIGTYQRHKAGPQPVPAADICRFRGRSVEEKNAWDAAQMVDYSDLIFGRRTGPKAKGAAEDVERYSVEWFELQAAKQSQGSAAKEEETAFTLLLAVAAFASIFGWLLRTSR